jgi:hypothetical protein
VPAIIIGIAVFMVSSMAGSGRDGDCHTPARRKRSTGA